MTDEPDVTRVDFNDRLMASTLEGVDLSVIMKATEMMAAEQIVPREGIYYLSFAGEEGWRGGCFVLAEGPITAISKTHDLGINPGGEVVVWGPGLAPVPERLMYRILSREEVETNPWGDDDAGA